MSLKTCVLQRSILFYFQFCILFEPSQESLIYCKCFLRPYEYTHVGWPKKLHTYFFFSGLRYKFKKITQWMKTKVRFLSVKLSTSAIWAVSKIETIWPLYGILKIQDKNADIAMIQSLMWFLFFVPINKFYHANIDTLEKPRWVWI